MATKPPTCIGCPLHTLGKGFALPEGSGRNGVLLLGEALGEAEVIESRPFVGPTGKLLDRILARTADPETRLPLKRDDFKIINCVSCQPPFNELTGAPYEMGALEHCRQYVEALIAEMKPRCIVALGNQALRWATSHWGIDALRGYTFETKWGPVVGTYHPAYIMRGKMALATVFQYDLLSALRVSREGVLKAEKRYHLHPSPTDAYRFYQEYLDAGTPPLAADIETPRASLDKDEELDAIVQEDDPSYTILRISFSFKPFEGISVPWSPPYSDIARALLKAAPEVLFWNENFDVPRLRANSAPIPGRILDAMWEFHFLEPALPMGLKFAATLYCPDLEAWKLKSAEEPEYYSVVDSDALLRTHGGVKEEIVRQGRWPIYERHVLLLSQVLRRVSEGGVRADPEKRQIAREGFEARFKVIVEKLKGVIPEALRPRKVYKIKKSTMEKKGLFNEGEWITVWEEAAVKPGWMVNAEGDLEKIPKPKKERKKRDGKREPVEGVGGKGGRPRRRRSRAEGGLQVSPDPATGLTPSKRDSSPARDAA